LNNFNSFKRNLYEVNEGSFGDIALELFRYQSRNNIVYREYLQHLHLNPDRISLPEDIPFLPLSFFKRHAIQTESWNPEIIFTSSGTTGATPSRHLVHDLAFYHTHSQKCFEECFGPLRGYHLLALLPSYLERDGSSLISMIAHFIGQTGSDESGFFLHDQGRLLDTIHRLRNSDRKILIWGVTFALLDLAENHTTDLSDCLVIETGGMKGRRKEITRQEFHEILKKRLNVMKVYSEYGMTELMSQAYTRGEAGFKTPPFMRVIGRDLSDPMEKGVVGETAGINIIDLANYHSIAFLETEDLGRVSADGSFEILGRIDNADIRGCNLMV
jgi:hypothetical protein